MILGKIIGTHVFSAGTISIEGASYSLAITPNRSNNPVAPNYQLIYKDSGNPFHDTRLSGLFSVKGSSEKYRGDILRNGKKQPFTLSIDKTKGLVTIGK